MVEPLGSADLRTRRGIGAPASQSPQSPWQGSPESTASAWGASSPTAGGAAPAWGVSSPNGGSVAPSWGVGSPVGASTWGGQGGHGGFGQALQREEDEPRKNEKFPPELILPLAIIFVAAFLLHADQNLAAPNLSAIANDFKMTPMQKDSRLGGMVQFVFYLIGGGVSLLFGPLADQMDRVTLLSIVMLCGAVPTLLMSLLAPDTKAGFVYYLLARICTGISVGGSYPVLFSLCADIFPPSWRIFISTCVGNTCGAAAGLGALMSGMVGAKFGWRIPFQVVAIPAIVCAVAVRLFVTDPRTATRNKKASEAMDSNNPAVSAWMGGQDATQGYMSMADLDLTKFQRIMTVKSNRLVFLQALPGCIPLSCIVTFLADYLAVEQGMTVRASTSTISVFSVSCIICAVSGGWYGSVIYQRKKENVPMLIFICSCIAPLPFIALVNAPQRFVTSASNSPTFLALLLAAMGGIANVTGPNVRSVLLHVNDSGLRGTAFSCFSLSEGIWKGLGPSLFVMLTAMFGHRLAYTAVFSCWWLSAAVHMMLRSELPRDAARFGGSALPTRDSKNV